LRLKAFFLFCIFLVGSALIAAPPPVPSAGIIERELEKEYNAKPLEEDKQTPAIQIDIPEEKYDMPDGKKVFISEVMIVGNQAISEREIQKLVQGYVGQELSLADIYQMCSEIDQYYAKKGYFLARAYPPAQEVIDGVLTIEILEGKLGNIQVIGNKAYSESFILSYFKSLRDKPLCYDDFLRALMLLNDNSDLMVGALFEKGKEFGYADVILRVRDKRPIHLYLNGNNYGRFLTTNTRIGGRLDWGNLLFTGDKLSVAEVIGFPVKALYFTDVKYRVPLNRKGSSLEGAYLYSRFHIEELESLRLRGKSVIGTLKFNQAVIRSRSMSVDFFSYFDYKQIQNFVLGQRTSFDKLRVVTTGFTMDHFGGGRDYLNTTFAFGIPDFLGGLKAVDSESSRIGAGGRFYIVNADYDRIQPLPKDMYFYFHGSGQWSPGKLTLPEQIYIGGDDTVRGFPLAAALGDSGYYLNFEFRIPPPFFGNTRFFTSKKKWKEIIQFDAFLDHGGVFLQSQKDTFLWGAGVGARVYGPCSLTFSIDVGFPLNHRDLTRGFFTYIKLTAQPF
jgi:hemolysin activation/secretion protein